MEATLLNHPAWLAEVNSVCIRTTIPCEQRQQPPRHGDNELYEQALLSDAIEILANQLGAELAGKQTGEEINKL
ncbi:hypothetical protein [Herbaspirillum seropedicae]|uniref:hypothetical protein n=1 Tax=Herbaspirillum seropedicae TaxID=964 RepID=UPI00086382D6|nr:hypothetical protein [Herbaspirillum seropedicae]AON53128.1 hypothetical protein Hsc_0824 [Herbaspirillum seropedicae]